MRECLFNFKVANMLEEILDIDCRKRGRAAPLFLVKKIQKIIDNRHNVPYNITIDINNNRRICKPASIPRLEAWRIIQKKMGLV